MDFPANERDKPGYVLEFSDEFEGDALDRSKWFPYLLPHWSTFEAAEARYAIGGGALKLLIERDQGRWRANNDRASNLQTGNFSGPKGSRVGQFKFYDGDALVTEDVPVIGHYLPKFGYFETRLKAVPVVGYHVALWMIGHDAPQAGEIRVLEIHGGNVGSARSRVDYGILRWDDPALQDEIFEDQLEIDATEYHVYALEWTPTHVDFFVDNRKLRRVQQSPQYPMQFMLGVYERPHEVIGDARDADFPRVCAVDYFRAYQPIGGYARNR
jgi:hypothetical protein